MDKRIYTHSYTRINMTISVDCVLLHPQRYFYNNRGGSYFPLCVCILVQSSICVHMTLGGIFFFVFVFYYFVSESAFWFVLFVQSRTIECHVYYIHTYMRVYFYREIAYWMFIIIATGEREAILSDAIHTHTHTQMRGLRTLHMIYIMLFSICKWISLVSFIKVLNN